MSQKVISQRMQRICDGCGKTQEWEIQNASDIDVLAMADVFTIVREHFVPEQGQFIKRIGQACSLDCVPVVAAKVALPPSVESAADDIDLASLRTNLAN